MKRKLRFRAWNPKENKFEYLDVLHSHSLGTTLPIPSRGLWDDLKDFEQFIGIVDKNNKYIFEGDLFDAGVGNLYQIYWNDKNAKFSIKSIRTSGKMVGIPKIEILELSQMEIIGNIHENPELL